VTLHEDVARWEAKCIKNERQYAWKQERCKGAARAAAKMWARSLPMNQSPQETLRRMRRGK
jgi:hypothetical protein